MPVLAIVRRDLLRFVRNPMRAVLLLAIPLALAGVFALAFGGGGPDLRIRVLVFDEDEGVISGLLTGALGNAGDFGGGERLEIVPVGEEGYAMMEEGEASALIRIPEGFSEDFLAGREATLELVKNPSQRFLPQIVQEGLDLGAVVASQASRVLRPELDTLQGMLDGTDAPGDLQVAQLAVALNQRVQSLDRYVLPPAIELETVDVENDAEAGGSQLSGPANVLAFFLPGLAVLGLLFFSQAATRDVVVERESGLLKQLLTAPVSISEYVAGKCLSVVVISLLGFGVLIAVGAVAGVPWGDPLAVVALIVVAAFASSGLLLLLMSVAGNEKQADALTTIVIIVSSMVGGSFLPIGMIPDFLLPLSRATINYWVASGFDALLRGDGGLGEVLTNVAVLGGLGALFLAIGAAVMHRRLARGMVR
jgi:ABC-type Na+ efflux pump permease subunit